MVDLGECKPLNARISTRQCNINRERGLFSCSKCAGLVNAQLVDFKEESMVTEPKPKRGNHYLCIVPGCTKVRVKGQMCMKHWRISQAAASKTAEDVAIIPPASASFEPCDPALTMGATSAPLPHEDKPASILSLIPTVSTPTPPPGIFIDFSGKEHLLQALQQDVGSDCLPQDILCLLELLYDGKLRRVA
jgi:hypothetical protein